MMNQRTIRRRITACEEMLRLPQSRAEYVFLVTRLMTYDEIIGNPPLDVMALFPHRPLPVSVQSPGIQQELVTGTQGGQVASASSYAVPPSQPMSETSNSQGAVR